jgi:hypothetical protein
MELKIVAFKKISSSLLSSSGDVVGSMAAGAAVGAASGGAAGYISEKQGKKQ